MIKDTITQRIILLFFGPKVGKNMKIRSYWNVHPPPPPVIQIYYWPLALSLSQFLCAKAYSTQLHKPRGAVFAANYSVLRPIGGFFTTLQNGDLPWGGGGEDVLRGNLVWWCAGARTCFASQMKFYAAWRHGCQAYRYSLWSVGLVNCFLLLFTSHVHCTV